MKKVIKWFKGKLPKKEEKKKLVLTPIRVKAKKSKELSAAFVIVLYAIIGTILSFAIQCAIERCGDV